MKNHTVGRPLELLLVEDSLTHAQLTMGALRNGKVKHRMTLLRDGEEALEFLCQERKYVHAPQPDLVLLDLRLPGLDGLDVLKRMRQIERLRNTPVVIMTASEDEEDRLRCQSLNVQSYIVKPVDLHKFLGIVAELKRYWHADVILPEC
ncbi:MAG: response regulator [Pirellulaceae bacterium]|nr:response regulator [Planctomycetales bacterium]